MRIVYLYPSMAIYGGIERIFVDKMNLLVQLYGYDVTLVTSDQGSHAIPFELDAQVRHIDLDIRFHQRYRYGVLRRWWEYRRLKRLYAARLRQTLTELQPDVLVCTTFQQVQQLLKLKGRIPLVVESHLNYSHPDTLWHHVQRRVNNHYIGKADAVVTLTEGDARQWRRVSDEVRVIPNVVHLNDTGRLSDGTVHRAVFAGRFTEQKGIGTLMDVWQLVHQRHPDWQLDLYGQGEEWDHYHQRAETLDARITVHPPTAHVFDEYLSSAMLLVTSVYEPFGLVIPEAMSCGLPVVAFDCPFGPAAIITDGTDGFVVPGRDVEAFADCVCQLIENLELRQRMGLAAVNAAQRFSPERIMPLWKELFEKIQNRQ